MVEERRVKEPVTSEEDPRRIDRERVSEEALDEVAEQEAIVRPQPPSGQLGVSSDAPGRDLDELEDAPEVPKFRHVT